MKYILNIIVLHLCILTTTVFAKDDFQYWSRMSFKMYDGEHVDLITFTDTRFADDVSKASLYYVSERLKFDYWKNLSLGLNYTYLNSRNISPSAVMDDYKFQHRVELEVNPHWKPKDWLKISMRNRMEFRWIEDKGSHNTRYRHRWTLTLPIKKHAFIKSIYMDGEVFYDIAEHEYKENRTVPFGVNFKLTDKASLNLYYMLQSQKGSDDWASNQILGTTLSWQF